MTELIAAKCSVFQISFPPYASLQDDTWMGFIYWGRKWSRQVNGACEIMVLGKEVPGFFHCSKAWLLLVHWPSQRPHIPSSKPAEILGLQNAHAGFGRSQEIFYAW